MLKKKSGVARRSWNLLRLSLMWARKGGVLKRRLMIDLRLFPKYLRSLRHSSHHKRAFHYGERQLSFDDTPIIHVKMHRPSSLRFQLPRIPCINPEVIDFDYDFELNRDDDEDVIQYNINEARKSFFKDGYGDQDVYDDCEVYDDDDVDDDDDEGIDVRAEEFIAKFYQQMKMQRQISYLQYNDMLNT